MKLPDEAILEYYNTMRECGAKLSEKEARKQASRLLQLFLMLEK